MFVRPRTLCEAIDAVAAPGATVLAGATDLYPSHVGRPLAGAVVDITGVAELRGIAQVGSHIRIGAATRWGDIAGADLPPAFDALRQAAREVGSLQIQNRGTIGGNLCNASPAADGMPPLLALDAEVELVSPAGTRRLALASFVTGYRRTALRPGELLAAILVPALPAGTGSAFVKLGARRYLVISIVMAAAVVVRAADGGIAEARVAVGAASAVAMRLPGLEQALRGLAPGRRPSDVVDPGHLAGLAPVDDVRATAAYRRDAARHLVGEVLDRAAGLAAGG